LSLVSLTTMLERAMRHSTTSSSPRSRSCMQRSQAGLLQLPSFFAWRFRRTFLFRGRFLTTTLIFGGSTHSSMPGAAAAAAWPLSLPCGFSAAAIGDSCSAGPHACSHTGRRAGRQVLSCCTGTRA
jgi:hypothetical protein